MNQTNLDIQSHLCGKHKSSSSIIITSVVSLEFINPEGKFFHNCLNCI